MDELLALQKELAAVQSAPSVFRLSEPNVVEVMIKLAELGLVEPAVVDSAAVDGPRGLRSLAWSLLACRPRSELSAGGLGV